MKNFLNVLLVIFISTGMAYGQCVDTVYLDLVETETNNGLTLSFEVEDFDDIVSMQYTLSYDTGVLDFSEMENATLPGFSNSSLFESIPGKIGIAWVDPNVSGASLIDGTSLFDFNFTRISQADPQFEITANPVVIELSNNEGLVCLNVDGSINSNTECDAICLGSVTANLTNGTISVYADDFLSGTQNCDLTDANLILTDSNGNTIEGNSITLTESGLYDYIVQFDGQECGGTFLINGGTTGGGNGNSSDCVDSLSLIVEAYKNGDDYIVELLANQFTDIQSAQFSLNYNGNALVYASVESALPGFSMTSTNVTQDGKIGLVWIDQTGQNPFSIADGETVFKFYFKSKAMGFSEFTITDDPTFIEFGNSASETVCFGYESGGLNIDPPTNSVGTDCVFLDVESTFDGTEVRVDVKTYNFNDILSFQFALKYDPAVMQFDRLEGSDLVSFNDFNIFDTGEFITASWIDGTVMGEDLEDGGIVYTIYFKALQNSNTELYITDDEFRPDYTEFADASGRILCTEYESTVVTIDGAHYYGYIIVDENLDCQRNTDELGLKDWFVTLTDGNNTFNFDTDDQGYYSLIVPPGSYTISAHAPNDLWMFCENDIEAVTLDNDDFFFYDFAAQAEIFCPMMTVDLSAPFLRRCFENNYHLSYCNQGTVTAEDSYIEVVLDDYLNFVDSDFTDYDVNGQTIRFNLGDVALGDCGRLKFRVEVSCDAELGETHCSEATIYPIDGCLTTNANKLNIEATCDGDSVRFEIENISNEVVESSFIVIEDDVMQIEQPLDIEPSTKFELGLESNGSTYRLTAYQDQDNPVASMVTKAIEACGLNDQGTFSTGFVTMFAESDGGEYIDIDCQENIGSFDPNDKMGSPKGYRSQHLINAETSLEYRLRFQNTGTDTAFRVVVKDRLTEDLDLLSLQLGSSSHPYTFSLEDSRVMVFTFDNIDLVPEEADEELSNGFVEFKIDQTPNNADGTRILNDAEIYFDFNEAIITNETDHLIGSDFVENVISNINVIHPDLGLDIYPNPYVDHFFVQLENIQLENAEIEMFDLIGRKVETFKLVNPIEQINFNPLAKGDYIFRIKNAGNVIATGKIITH